MSVKTEPPGTGESVPQKKISPHLTAWLVILCAFSLFCVLVYGAISLTSDYLSHSTQNYSARLEVKRGPVYIYRADQNITVLANATDKLELGDAISTDEQSSAHLTLFDGTRLDISPYTRVLLANSQVSITNFVKKEKKLKVEITPATTEDARAVVGEVSIWPISPYDNEYAGEPVQATTADGARIDFNTTGKPNFEIEVQRASDNSSRTFITSAATNQLNLDVAQNAQPDQKVALAPGKRILVDNGQAPVEVTALQDELIRNNRAFINGLDAWTTQKIESGDLDNVDCKLFSDGERIDDGTIARVHTMRYDNAKDAHECSLRQDLNVDVTRYQSLVFRFKLKVIYQSLTGGGVEGNEFPVFIKIGYVDSKGVALEYFKGFYYAAEDRALGTRVSSNGIQVKQNQWVEFVSEDFMTRRPKPIKITSVVVGSSGHEFEAVFTDLSLEGRG